MCRLSQNRPRVQGCSRSSRPDGSSSHCSSTFRIWSPSSFSLFGRYLLLFCQRPCVAWQSKFQRDPRIKASLGVYFPWIIYAAREGLSHQSPISASFPGFHLLLGKWSLWVFIWGSFCCFGFLGFSTLLISYFWVWKQDLTSWHDLVVGGGI